MIGFESTMRMYCQVSPLSHVLLYTVVNMNYDPKVWITFDAVSTPFQLPRLRHLIYFRFFLGLLLHCLCVRFSVDCNSHVRLLFVHDYIFPKQALKGFLAESPFGTWRRFPL